MGGPRRRHARHDRLRPRALPARGEGDRLGRHLERRSGIPGVELTGRLLWDHALTGRVALEDVVRWTSEAPARVFGLDDRKGFVRVGGDADLVLLDPARDRTDARGDLRQPQRRQPAPRVRSPLPRPDRSVWSRGRLAAEGGRVVAAAGSGAVLTPTRPQTPSSPEGPTMTTATILGGTLFEPSPARSDPTPGCASKGASSLPSGSTRVPTVGDTFDATGKTVLPGLANLHGHLAWDAFSDLEGQCRYDGPMGYLKAARGLISAVEAGVTTFRDLACVHDTGLMARQAQRDGLLPGPKVVACGRAVCRTGGHIHFGNREADGVAEVIKATREQIKAGADWIKLMAHGYSSDELHACIDTAHELGIPVTTDAGAWAERAVDAGVDCIEHGGNYSDELIAKIVERGVWIVPTLSPVVLQAREGHAWGMKQSVIDRRRGQLADKGRQEGLGRARRAGAKLAFGTDSGSPVVPHDALLGEVDALLELGVFDTLNQVLQAMTIRAAECVRLAEDRGSLAPSKRADIVLVDGNLEDDRSALQRVDRVYRSGRLVVDGGHGLVPDPRDYQTFVGVGA